MSFLGFNLSWCTVKNNWGFGNSLSKLELVVLLLLLHLWSLVVLLLGFGFPYINQHSIFFVDSSVSIS